MNKLIYIFTSMNFKPYETFMNLDYVLKLGIFGKAH